MRCDRCSPAAFQKKQNCAQKGSWCTGSKCQFKKVWITFTATTGALRRVAKGCSCELTETCRAIGSGATGADRFQAESRSYFTSNGDACSVAESSHHHVWLFRVCQSDRQKGGTCETEQAGTKKFRAQCHDVLCLSEVFRLRLQKTRHVCGSAVEDLVFERTGLINVHGLAIVD